MSNIKTPWGEAQTVKQIAPGITWYETASHGGFYLSPEKNALVPQELKEATFGQLGLEGWYEEDCDAEVVYTIFPSEYL